MIQDMLPLSGKKMDVLFEIYSLKRAYLRQIARNLGMAPSLCHKLLRSVSKSGILRKERSGKEIYYMFAASYKSLLLAGLLDEFYVEKAALSSPKIAALAASVRANKPLTDACTGIYVFGSYARGAFKKESDIDMLFVTDDKMAVSLFVRESSSALNKEINAIIFSEKELLHAMEKKDSIITPIISRPKERLVLWRKPTVQEDVFAGQSGSP